MDTIFLWQPCHCRTPKHSLRNAARFEKMFGQTIGSDLRLEPFHYKLLTAAFKEMLNNMDVWM